MVRERFLGLITIAGRTLTVEGGRRWVGVVERAASQVFAREPGGGTKSTIYVVGRAGVLAALVSFNAGNQVIYQYIRTTIQQCFYTKKKENNPREGGGTINDGNDAAMARLSLSVCFLPTARTILQLTESTPRAPRARHTLPIRPCLPQPAVQSFQTPPPLSRRAH